MVQIDLNEKYTDMFDFSSIIGGSNGIVNSLANNFQNYLFFEKKDVEEYLKFLQDIPNYIDYAIVYTNEYAASSSFFSKPSIKTFVFLPTSSSIASLLT